MNTSHRLLLTDARQLSTIPDKSVHLVVTSPPYPMIEMWDRGFAEQSEEVRLALQAQDGNRAFAGMHAELDKVWAEVGRVLADGCFACINLGDATRTLGDRFRLYSNHSRVTQTFLQLGFDALPLILWQKATNAPNKFMGSGMLPAGAYVTLEHEYILIFRKGGKRIFDSEARTRRSQSAFFWEERNRWFSDTWDLKGVRQKLSDEELRGRSAAFPFELPYRLIQMYSVYGDTVLDPFVGTGTTMAAAVASARNGIGVEGEPGFQPLIKESILQAAATGNERTAMRLREHLAFLEQYRASKGEPGYLNRAFALPVVTTQEQALQFYCVERVEVVEVVEGVEGGSDGFCFRASYSPWPFRTRSLSAAHRGEEG